MTIRVVAQLLPSPEAFSSYLSAFPGEVVVLIGPVDGARHCDPDPEALEGKDGWSAAARHDVGGCGQDRVVVYRRIRKGCDGSFTTT